MNIPRSQLINTLENIAAKGAQAVTVIFKNEEPLLKKGRDSRVPAPFAKVSKVQTWNGFVHADYQRAVNKRKVEQGEQANFVASSAYFTHEFDGAKHGAVVANKKSGKKYLQFTLKKVMQCSAFSPDNNPVDLNTIREFLPLPNKNKKQGLDKTVQSTTISLDNILIVRHGGKDYIVQ